MIGRAIRRFIDWACSRPVMAAFIAQAVAHRGLGMDWLTTIALTILVYCFVSDGDEARSNITITVEPNRATDFLYQAHDYNDFLRQQQARERARSGGGGMQL